MHLTGIKLGGVPPFTEPITLRFDERVNVFIGPNASGKSTLLTMLYACFDERVWGERSVSEGIHAGARFDSIERSDDWDDNDEPDLVLRKLPAVKFGSVREALPNSPKQLNLEEYGETAEKVLEGPFSGSRLMCAFGFLDRELPSLPPSGRFFGGQKERYAPRLEFNRARALADACSKAICGEVIRDSNSHNYIYGQDVDLVKWMNRSDVMSMELPIRPNMGINTTDARNFEALDELDRPEPSAYSEGENSIPIYLGHLSSGTEGTLLWIRWLALKIAYHYDFAEGWLQKPAILLIDEIENHLHPTWQRRVIPALLEHFPGLQIFATTHSPFVVAGLKAGQVHKLERDGNGVVRATTEERDVVGWTADEILRGMMGVEEPTDERTVIRAKRLRELREKDILNEVEEEELNRLRRQVNEDLLKKGGPLEAQRERYADLMEKFLRSRMSDLGQEGE